METRTLGRGSQSVSALGFGCMALNYPIPGTTKLYRLEENVAAAAVDFTPDDLSNIEYAASPITIHGDR
jgi:aryl-alcohol dehydrogenase-like predicted oxidoreductase